MHYPSEILCKVVRRVNVHVPGGVEYALNISLDKQIWTLKTYRKKPKPATVQLDLELILRAMDFYHDITEYNRSKFVLRMPEIVITD